MINRLGGLSSGGAQKINLSERAYLTCSPNLRNGQRLRSDPCDGGTVVGDHSLEGFTPAWHRVAN